MADLTLLQALLSVNTGHALTPSWLIPILRHLRAAMLGEQSGFISRFGDFNAES
jgi:hypothetical protein